MDHFYNSERSVQILIALMKAHHIRKIIVSPGTTNISFVASVQHDDYFELFSAADERSAAYMATGLAAESGEPVALSCTGATASRNYIPALTEAFYRKLPILAITSTQHESRIGMHVPQVIDRGRTLNDMVQLSVRIPVSRTDEDFQNAEVRINQALLELRRHGGMPVHINLETEYSRDFSIKKLPEVRVIRRFFPEDEFPVLSEDAQVGIFVGAHLPWRDDLLAEVELFCRQHNAVVCCDHTSNYRGDHPYHIAKITAQTDYISSNNRFDVVIYIGEVSGAYSFPRCHEVWRVSPDGEIRDFSHRTTAVFEMPEEVFFRRCNAAGAPDGRDDSSLAAACRREEDDISGKLPELPFSNLYAASVIAPRLPEGSTLYLGILNCLRSWNFFDIPKSVNVYSNTGGFGIDGGVSTLLGLSLANPGKLCFGVVGDLGFFYDMNVLGNRHVGANMRIVLVNNGIGTEFKNYTHYASEFGDAADAFIAAGGHYGCRSKALVRHYAEDLGFAYYAASTKEELSAVLDEFLSPAVSERPMLLEIFTTPEDENAALKAMKNAISSLAGSSQDFLRRILPENAKKAIKKLIKK